MMSVETPLTTHLGETELVAAVREELRLRGALGTPHASKALQAAERLPAELADSEGGSPRGCAQSIDEAFLSIMYREAQVGAAAPPRGWNFASHEEVVARQELDAATARRVRATQAALTGRDSRAAAPVGAVKVTDAVVGELVALQGFSDPDGSVALKLAAELDNMPPDTPQRVDETCQRIHDHLRQVSHSFTTRGGALTQRHEELFRTRVDVLAQRSGGRVRRAPGSSYTASAAR